MPYLLTDEMLDELREITRVAHGGNCIFSGAMTIKDCPICGHAKIREITQ